MAKWKYIPIIATGQSQPDKNMPLIDTQKSGCQWDREWELIQLCIRCIEFSGWQTNKLHKYKWKCALTRTRPIGTATIRPTSQQTNKCTYRTYVADARILYKMSIYSKREIVSRQPGGKNRWGWRFWAVGGTGGRGLALLCSQLKLK